MTKHVWKGLFITMMGLLLIGCATQKPQTPNSQNNGHNGPSKSKGGRLSNKQLLFIMRLANRRGLTKRDLDAHCINVFGVAPDFLSKKDYSVFEKETVKRLVNNRFFIKNVYSIDFYEYLKNNNDKRLKLVKLTDKGLEFCIKLRRELASEQTTCPE